MEYAADMHTVYTERKKKRERQHRNLLNNLWPQLGGERGRAARPEAALSSCYMFQFDVYQKGIHRLGRCRGRGRVQAEWVT